MYWNYEKWFRNFSLLSRLDLNHLYMKRFAWLVNVNMENDFKDKSSHPWHNLSIFEIYITVIAQNKSGNDKIA